MRQPRRHPRDFQPKDVVFIFSNGDMNCTTGVVNRVDPKTDMVNVFMKGSDIGTWVFKSYLKRIGRTR